MSGINKISQNLPSFKKLCDKCYDVLCLGPPVDDKCPCEGDCHQKKAKEIKAAKPSKQSPTIILGTQVEEVLAKKGGFMMKGRAGAIHMSGIGSAPRQLLLGYLGVSESWVEVQSARYMRQGTVSHDRKEEEFKRAGLMVSSEQNVKHPVMNIRGRYDFIIRSLTPDDPTKTLLIEFKTTGSKKIKEMTEPNPDHVAQWSAYSDLTRVYQGFVAYEERDSIKTTFYPITNINGNVTLYTPRGRKIKELTNFVPDLYEKVEFSIWCADNKHFPKDRCADCIKWGCGQPKLCGEYSKDRPQITLEEWLANGKGAVKESKD
jgi:hypothetical protein